MKITLTEEKEVVIVKEHKITISEIEILQVIDIPKEKKVIASTDTIGIVVLWFGDEYDAIGQWTDDDVVNRINELI